MVSSLASGSENKAEPDAVERAESSSIEREVRMVKRKLQQLLQFTIP
jgi:hypothetical protein